MHPIQHPPARIQSNKHSNQDGALRVIHRATVVCLPTLATTPSISGTSARYADNDVAGRCRRLVPTGHIGTQRRIGGVRPRH